MGAQRFTNDDIASHENMLISVASEPQVTLATCVRPWSLRNVGQHIRRGLPRVTCEHGTHDSWEAYAQHAIHYQPVVA